MFPQNIQFFGLRSKPGPQPDTASHSALGYIVPDAQQDMIALQLFVRVFLEGFGLQVWQHNLCSPHSSQKKPV